MFQVETMPLELASRPKRLYAVDHERDVWLVPSGSNKEGMSRYTISVRGVQFDVWADFNDEESGQLVCQVLSVEDRTSAAETSDARARAGIGVRELQVLFAESFLVYTADEYSRHPKAGVFERPVRILSNVGGDVFTLDSFMFGGLRGDVRKGSS